MSAAPDEVVFRRGGPEDFDGLIELNRQTYGDEPWTTRKYFEWQYARGPDGPAIVYVATAGQRIVGSYLLMLQTMSVFGRSCLTAHSVGTVVHEDYRRHLSRAGSQLRTVFARLADMGCEECEQRGITLTFTFPNASSYPTFVDYLGFRDLGPIPFYAKPVRPGRILAERLHASGWLARGVGGLIDPVFRLPDLVRRAPAARSWRVEEARHADERFDRLWARCQPAAGVVRQRDRAYVQWRFLDHPIFAYRVWLAEDETGPLAFVATTIAEQKDRARGTAYRLGHVVDFLCAPHERAGDILADLIRQACREMQQERVEFIIAAHSGSAAGRDGLRRGGMHAFSARRAPRKWPCVVRVHQPEVLPDARGVFELGQWYLNLSDNDLV